MATSEPSGFMFLAGKMGYSQQYARMTIAPENRPPVPMPAIALPTINATLLGAVAQTRELLPY
jgi:hypothetical protein